VKLLKSTQIQMYMKQLQTLRDHYK